MSAEREAAIIEALTNDPEWRRQIEESQRKWNALACWVIAANDDLKVVRDAIEDERCSSALVGIAARSRLRHWLNVMPNADTVTVEELRRVASGGGSGTTKET